MEDNIGIPLRRRTPMMSSLLAMAAMMGGMGQGIGMDMGSLGATRGMNGKPKAFDNSPDRAPGLKPFEIDGKIYHAGTLKGARKMARRDRG